MTNNAASFCVAPAKVLPYDMPLRILLRVVIAIGLLLQGGLGATAAYASSLHGHHCHSSASHDGRAPKCPCCPSKSFGMNCADACMTFVVLPALSASLDLPLGTISHPIVRTRLIVAAIDTPLRPPIA